MSIEGTRDRAAALGDSSVVEKGARLGYAASGVMHLLIAWLALQLATGRSSGSADQGGAMSTLASTGPGKVALWVAVVGFALLAVWQVSEAIRASELSDRLKAVGKTVLYLSLGVSAWRFIAGSGASSGGQTADATRDLMSAPGGRLLVGLVGIAVVVTGGYHVFKGARRKFLEDLRQHPGRPAEVAGQLGYVAKGVALMVVGVLFGLAAVRANPNESTGLDGALRKLMSLPFGQGLTVMVALGFAAFALYCFARARHAKV